LRQHDVEVRQQPGAARDIGPHHGLPFGLEMLAQQGQLRRRGHRAQLTHQTSFDHPPYLEDLACLFHAGTGDKGPARGLQGDQAIAAELVQRLTHQGAADLEDVGDGCSASLVPGISRRSTMALVMASAMRWVAPPAGSAAVRVPRPCLPAGSLSRSVSGRKAMGRMGRGSKVAAVDA
jgi:hypothetical protein